MKCETCGLPHLEGPFARPCYYVTLRAALGEYQPTPDEDRHLCWMAGLDRQTVDAFASIFIGLRQVRRMW